MSMQRPSFSLAAGAMLLVLTPCARGSDQSRQDFCSDMSSFGPKLVALRDNGMSASSATDLLVEALDERSHTMGGLVDGFTHHTLAEDMVQRVFIPSRPNAQQATLLINERCLNGMGTKTDNALGHPQTPELDSDANAGSLQTGLSDREAWETWFGGLSGDYRLGAEFWAGHRSLPHPTSCSKQEGASTDWQSGCFEAQRRLALSDVRRKAEPEYRAGWNSYHTASLLQQTTQNPNLASPDRDFPPEVERSAKQTHSESVAGSIQQKQCHEVIFSGPAVWEELNLAELERSTEPDNLLSRNPLRCSFEPIVFPGVVGENEVCRGGSIFEDQVAKVVGEDQWSYRIQMFQTFEGEQHLVRLFIRKKQATCQ